MRRILKEDFLFNEQFAEHRKYLAIEGCRIIDAVTEGQMTVDIIYRTEGAKWLVRYGPDGPGDIDLYFHVPAMDNLKALKELLRKETQGL